MYNIEYDNPEFRYRTLVNIPISQVYGNLLNIVYYKLAKEISFIIGGYKDYHVNTEIAIKKRLMKTPRSLLTKAKPFLLFNTSVNLEYLGGHFEGMGFNSGLFDTDSVDPLSNVIFLMNDRHDKNKNLKVSLLFSEHELNVEANVIIDSRQTILNLYNDWNMLRTFPVPDVYDHIIKVPISEVIIGLICELLKIDDIYSDEALIAVKRYSEGNIVYEKDVTTGNNRYFLRYLTPVTIIPSTANIANGELDGGLMKNAILTRPFVVRFNAPTKIHIDAYSNRIKVKTLEEPQVTTELSIMSTHFKNLDWELDDKDLVFTGIKEQKNDVETLNILEAQRDTIQDFIKWVQSYDTDPSTFYALRMQNEDETDYTGTKITFDEDTFDIEMREEKGKRITFSFYIYKAAYLEYKKM